MVNIISAVIINPAFTAPTIRENSFGISVFDSFALLTSNAWTYFYYDTRKQYYILIEVRITFLASYNGPVYEERGT